MSVKDSEAAPPRSAPADTAKAGHRQRLLEGMASCVTAKGYAETTIGDIVARAAVSRRTFYEHFNNKAECLLALYETASRQGLSVLRGAVDPAMDWPAQTERALAAYLGWMSQTPALARTLFTEVPGMGPQGLAARRRIHADMARFIQSIVNTQARRAGPLTPGLATALVGGIHELVFEAIEQGRAAVLAELAPVAAELVRRVAGDQAAA